MNHSNSRAGIPPRFKRSPCSRRWRGLTPSARRGSRIGQAERATLALAGRDLRHDRRQVLGEFAMVELDGFAELVGMAGGRDHTAQVLEVIPSGVDEVKAGRNLKRLSAVPAESLLRLAYRIEDDQRASRQQCCVALVLTTAAEAVDDCDIKAIHVRDRGDRVKVDVEISAENLELAL